MTDERADDETVSAAYRDLAGEHCPAQLDKEVLRLAESHAQHANYARSINWTRPLAWAATIALCLAITLEINRVPAPEEMANRAEAKALPEAAEADDAAVGRAQKLEDAPASERYRRADNEEAPAAAFELKSKDTPMLRQAEEMARFQSGTNVQQRARISRCPQEIRAEPSSWLQCIEALEEIGDHEAASLEREALVETFPDFKLP